MDMSRFFPLLFVLALAGCSSAPRTGVRVPKVALTASDGADHELLPKDGARLTVLVFSAWHCPCQAAHDVRLNDLFARYHARGVDLYVVDSEVSSSATEDAEQAKKRGYAFPVLLDSGAGLARSLHAEYATESFVLDREGTVRYHGGFDSDRTTLHGDAVPHLENALDDLLGERPLRQAETKALGCALQTW
jgi:peroxiredoxin